MNAESTIRLTAENIETAVDAAGICKILKNDKTGLLAQRCDLWLLDLDLVVCYGKRTRKGCSIGLRLAESYGGTGAYLLTQSPIHDRRHLDYVLVKFPSKPSDDGAKKRLRMELRRILHLIVQRGLHLKLVYYGDGEDDEGNMTYYGDHEWHFGKHKTVEFVKTPCRVCMLADRNPNDRARIEGNGWSCVQN